MDIDIKKVYKIEFWLIIVILGAFLVFDVYPNAVVIFSILQKRNISRQEAVALPLEAKEKIRQELLSEQTKLDAGDSAMRDIVSNMQKKMSKEESIPNIALKLEELARACGIDLLGIRPFDPVRKDGYEIVMIDLEFESEYMQLVNFLSRWNDTPYCLGIETLAIVKTKQMSSKLDIKLKLKVLFQAV